MSWFKISKTISQCGQSNRQLNSSGFKMTIIHMQVYSLTLDPPAGIQRLCAVGRGGHIHYTHLHGILIWPSIWHRFPHVKNALRKVLWRVQRETKEPLVLADLAWPLHDLSMGFLWYHHLQTLKRTDQVQSWDRCTYVYVLWAIMENIIAACCPWLCFTHALRLDN